MSKKKLKVEHTAQLRDNDCCIACAKMVIDYVRAQTGQEQLLGYSEFLDEVKTLGLFADDCPGVTDLINQYLGTGVYRFHTLDEGISHVQIKEYIDAGFPVIAGVGQDNGSGHAVVIFEYSDDNVKGKDDCFKILDPLCTKQEMESGEKVPYLGGLKISYDEFDAGLVDKTFVISGISRHS